MSCQSNQLGLCFVFGPNCVHAQTWNTHTLTHRTPVGWNCPYFICTPEYLSKYPSPEYSPVECSTYQSVHDEVLEQNKSHCRACVCYLRAWETLLCKRFFVTARCSGGVFGGGGGGRAVKDKWEANAFRSILSWERVSGVQRREWKVASREGGATEGLINHSCILLTFC